jgi:malate dehydrogenase (oxaloacetate-decarboxylating)
MLRAAGVSPPAIVACDSKGTLHSARSDLEEQQELFRDKWRVCGESNGEQVRGGIAEALRGADVCIAFSRPGPNLIAPEMIRTMARDAIVFACANPVPEIWPWDAAAAGARIVATGRSDFPNQVNNSLGFPGIFRGVLDVRARSITDGMALAAARELAQCGAERGLDSEHILPTMDDIAVHARVAAATAAAAQQEGLARLATDRRVVYEAAFATIRKAREATAVLMREKLIPAPP